MIRQGEESQGHAQAAGHDRLAAVIRAMIDHPDQIVGTVRSGDEFYFEFRNHKMSVLRRLKPDASGGPSVGTEFVLFLYPRYRGTLGELANQFDAGMADEVTMASFVESDVADPDSLRQLYEAIKNKHLGLQEIFDDILGLDNKNA